MEIQNVGPMLCYLVYTDKVKNKKKAKKISIPKQRFGPKLYAKIKIAYNFETPFSTKLVKD